MGFDASTGCGTKWGAMLYVAIVPTSAAVETLAQDWSAPADREYVARRERPQMSLLGLAALRALLFKVTGRSDWHLSRSQFGKPYAQTADEMAGPAVSISHTVGLVGVAVACGGAVGIDVERHRKRNIRALAAAAFGPVEQSEVAAEGADAFYRIWTVREAMAKATGDGLALVINRHDLAEGVVSGRIETRSRIGRSWGLFHAVPESGHSVALAWYDGAADVRLHWVDITDAAAPIATATKVRP